ncbi:alpha/beta hydrolase [Kitasatospora sp. RB6PN24]|uniref:alpha/beta fold hydrolase n=1 Tax=Kitasatospora humi TaxID=2893891 RepID=UPI001E29E936|nr:alpha/beta hydrolase [Kitasatospora humi]MCC9307219.1 alpha/beta hydrolase [Kitasatospora humi]
MEPDTVELNTLVLDGRRIAYRQSAGRGRAVVLVHGNSSSSRAWQALLDGPFGQRYRCLALDLPGHGGSAPAASGDGYSLPGHAEVLVRFVAAVDAQDALVVGHSLGGHIVLEAAPALTGCAGFAVFGTPPMADLTAMPVAFLPNPLVNMGFTAEVTPEEARAYAAGQLAPGSALPVEPIAREILATDGAARAGLAASLAAGAFADEVAVAAGLDRPLAVLHGREEQLVSLAYLESLELPRLWRGAVQVVEGAGHSLQLEAPEALAQLLTEFAEELA